MRPGAKKLPAQGALFCAGAFGENLVSLGINETNICIGDIFEIGSAVLQVTQPRQPCFKLNHRFGLPSMARRVQETGRTGWYYRVLSPGPIAAGDVIKLASRPHSDWTLRRVQHVLYVDTLNESALHALMDLPPLSEAMRKILAGRLTAASPEIMGCSSHRPRPGGCHGRRGGPQRLAHPACGRRYAGNAVG